MVGVACHRLSVDDILEAVEVIVVEVHRAGEVESPPELVFHHYLEACSCAFRHVLIGGVHLPVGAALVSYPLYHVGRGPVVCRE